jgi:hypothetical protein
MLRVFVNERVVMKLKITSMTWRDVALFILSASRASGRVHFYHKDSKGRRFKGLPILGLP